ncbi:MAG: hypothetical protein KA419_01370 [Acidobacteria bacterium]|nr:hypothetical protein [Acidobacteriota bacterium]
MKKPAALMPVIPFLALFALLGAPFAHAASPAKPKPGKPAAPPPDYQRLEGKWVRPDGGYVLELRDVLADGRLAASYFNPRKINVFMAKWSRKDGALRVYVELRDVNYPGSKYDLQYDPVSDRLLGTYFQAVEGQTYDIAFERARN